MPFAVLYRRWKDHGRCLPSESTVRRFLVSKGYDARSLKAGRLESGPTKAFEAPAPNDLWMVDFACGPTLRGTDGKVQTTWLCVTLDDHSLSELNAALSRWIATTYHLRVHSSTGQTPHQRFSAGAGAIRHVEDPEKIEPLFYTRTERVMRKNGTVALGKRLFEVPLALRALRVELRCGETGTPQPRLDPILCDPVEVWHKGILHGLARRCDLHLNSEIHHHRGTNSAR